MKPNSKQNYLESPKFTKLIIGSYEHGICEQPDEETYQQRETFFTYKEQRSHLPSFDGRSIANIVSAVTAMTHVYILYHLFSAGHTAHRQKYDNISGDFEG